MTQKKPIKIREDCRRDGIAANFLIDASMMKTLAEALPTAIIDVGYPSICSSEEKRVAQILEALKETNVESAVYSHAMRSHLDQTGHLIAPYRNASACFWIPTSDHFISQTLADWKPEDVLNNAVSLVEYFTKQYGKPVDVALTDTTRAESGLEHRLAEWSSRLSDAGARSLIVCDSLGIGNREIAERLFDAIRARYSGLLEFHGHDDNGTALDQVKVAVEHGSPIINTALFNASERGTLVSPQRLLQAGLNFPCDQERLATFVTEFEHKIGNPQEIVRLLYGPSTIVTGSQYRLRDRFADPKLLFGVTSDRFIYRKMTGSTAPDDVVRQEMERLKNSLYQQGKVCFDEREINVA